MSAPLPAAAIVLAAGEGKRMRSARPKVLHAFLGRSLLGHALEAVETVEPEMLMVVVGHGRDHVAAHLAQHFPAAAPVVQEEQHGTGHAVRIALEAAGELDGTVVVTMGDTPLLSGSTLQALVVSHEREGNAATVLTARIPGTDLGRVLRDESGSVLGIVEHRDATEAQRAIDEVNSGIYAFDARQLVGALGRLTAENAQGEEYLTDALGILRAQGSRVGALPAADATEILGVNDRAQLAEARQLLRDRIVARWMRDGVTVVDPRTTWIDVDVVLEPDTVLRPNIALEGRTVVRSGADLGPNCVIRDTVVGAGARVTDATVDGADVGPDASVGPYTYLRPGTRLGPGTRAGGFVEMKGAVLGPGSKVPHLSYVGDAEIGEGSNIGAATVFVNYDGVDKHRTTIGDHVRVGSDTMLIAPVTVADGAYTAAGSVITADVPPGAMAVARGRQRNIEGWVQRRRPGSPAAQAAARARQDGADAARLHGEEI